MKCSLPVFGTRLASFDATDAGFDEVLIIKLTLLILEKEITVGFLMKLVVLVDNAAFPTDEIVPRPNEVAAGVAERRMFALDPIVK